MSQHASTKALMDELEVQIGKKKDTPLEPNFVVEQHYGDATEEFKKECQSKIAKAIHSQKCLPSIAQAASALSSVAGSL